jgi:hypothetical protein
MSESQEVSGRKRRSREEIQRLTMEFELSGLRQNEFCREHDLASFRLIPTSSTRLWNSSALFQNTFSEQVQD